LYLPQLLALFRVKAEQVLVVLGSAQDVELVPDDGRRGVADAEVLEGPCERQPPPGPLLEEALFGGVPVAVGAEPLRPVRRAEGAAQAEQHEEGQGSHPCVSLWGLWRAGGVSPRRLTPSGGSHPRLALAINAGWRRRP